jgi:hypothetical protein
MDFDFRANYLRLTIEDSWDEKVKEQHRINQEGVRSHFLSEFGTHDANRKIQDFLDIEAAPNSVIFFHNKFLRQVREAFTLGAYYPALTGACALGERVINHLVLKLRDFYKSTPEYKVVFRHDSFDNWDIPIDTLEAWSIFSKDVADKFRELKDMRNQAIHFNPETDTNERSLSLSAIKKLSSIIQEQFSAFGSQPWFIPNDVGLSFIRKSYEDVPFIKVVYLPSCKLVGPRHNLQSTAKGWLVHDESVYEDTDITDEEFISLFKSAH